MQGTLLPTLQYLHLDAATVQRCPRVVSNPRVSAAPGPCRDISRSCPCCTPLVSHSTRAGLLLRGTSFSIRVLLAPGDAGRASCGPVHLGGIPRSHVACESCTHVNPLHTDTKGSSSRHEPLMFHDIIDTYKWCPPPPVFWTSHTAAFQWHKPLMFQWNFHDTNNVPCQKHIWSTAAVQGTKRCAVREVCGPHDASVRKHAR